MRKSSKFTAIFLRCMKDNKKAQTNWLALELIFLLAPFLTKGTNHLLYNSLV